MNKPDRFVDIFINEQSRRHRALFSVEIIALLRRQHRAYVRLVTRAMTTTYKGGPIAAALERGHRYACDDILAAFTRYAKGKGTP